MHNIIIVEMLKLKRTFILWVGVLLTAVMPLLTLLMNLEREITFDAFGIVSLQLSILLLFPCLYTLVATFIFNREHQEGTMKSLMCVPISRYKLAIAKFIVMLMFFLVLLIIHACLSAAMAAVSGSPGIAFQDFISILALNIRALPPYAATLPPIIAVIVISRKSYLAPLGVGVTITMVNMIVAQSRFSSIFPWVAVLRFSGDMEAQGVMNLYFASPMWVSAVSLLVCFVVGFFVVGFGLSRQEY